eukprot:TRINITY_DN16617_c0_g1_i1.p1 TRINITY_DN16617_c0_g1~~TRINITY_DN16617_c0_g1_i1.p1  ORF type:complete len:168 (+),score=40.90 TRINITY_DN16617_c0_g1_i1:33-506(+)
MMAKRAVAAGAQAAKGQVRCYRYRGQADIDVQTPWYWTPVEAPNYSQLPERWDWYMFQGYGQETHRFFVNPSAWGEHERMGRLFTTFMGTAFGFLFFTQLGFRAQTYSTFLGEDKDYLVSHYSDYAKHPFDGMYLYSPMSSPRDPAYVRHINSKDTY